MSGDNGYNGGPVKVRPHGWYSRIHQRKVQARFEGPKENGRFQNGHLDDNFLQFDRYGDLTEEELSELLPQYSNGHRRGPTILEAFADDPDRVDRMTAKNKPFTKEEATIDPQIFQEAVEEGQEIYIVNGKPVVIKQKTINPRDTFQQVGSLGFFIDDVFVYDQRDIA